MVKDNLAKGLDNNTFYVGDDLAKDRLEKKNWMMTFFIEVDSAEG